MLCHSILRQASGPVEFVPIRKELLPEFTRGMEDGSTEFSFSRFLTPYLAGYEGQAIFMDCDMLVRCDILELLNFISSTQDVSVVQHDYMPNTTTKFLGQTQSAYPKKNWSSLMVFNCFRRAVKTLTPEVVNTHSGAFLHQLKWAKNVGAIPLEYNHLVGEYDPNPNAKIVHFTLGTPCFIGYEHQEFCNDWFAEKDLMNGCINK